MVALVTCSQCALGDQGYAPIGLPHERVVVSPNDIVTWTCAAKGHKNQLWLQNPFYELLFLRGIYDLVERDYRNSVMNFFGAYETFIARTLRLLFAAKGVESEPPDQASAAMHVLRVLYSLQTGGAQAHRVSRAATSIRNDVVHGEKVPSEDEAILVGEEVRGFMKRSISELAPLHEGPKGRPEVVKRYAAAIERNPPEVPPVGTPYRSPSARLLSVDLQANVADQLTWYDRREPIARLI